MRHKAGPRKLVPVRLDPALVDQIDAVVAGNDLSRNETLTRMLRHALDCKVAKR